ncbi:hypothetical protein BJ085DRAFT_13361 [Dimargaris cristalligena]|uniref:HSP20-like chaperone n=1 Tax=Dimargaris cristalligena TaxID=215637 RepID=A0A4Q0A1U2_9FUNG|nr:hypothetical protein BJ085DRAFT_13361 [Dimargaris cristalligena]|eukprot:RKP40024.1 hypothetical protein BJ085DRAFT_13361 [Dimargaris cristalligena]
MPKCTQRGCLQPEFDSASNGPTACQFHPGKPVFHEGLKGWSCCSKRVVDFDDFMTLPGCTRGYHSEAQAETVQFGDTTTPVDDADLQRGGGGGGAAAAAAPSTDNNNNNNSYPQQPTTTAEEEQDPVDAIITSGTPCRHRGCNYQFESDAQSRDYPSSPAAHCHYHPGAPIFHEGSKGWSCCKRRVLEFDEFIKIAGCREGPHRFTAETTTASPDPTSTNNGQGEGEGTPVDCRRDWYQTPTQVIVSIFAKNVVRERSSIKFNTQSIDIHLVLPRDQVYRTTLLLAFPIHPDQSTFEFLSTKVELTLQKTNGISWGSLEPSANLTSWTTFGQGDSPLNVANGNRLN